MGFCEPKNLQQFYDCKFFIPNKKDWIVIPHKNVGWLNYNEFSLKSDEYLERKFSPLCWIKLKNGELKKVFLVWW